MRPAFSSLAAAAATCTFVAAPALAQQRGGISAQCQVNGAPVELALQYEVVGGAGITVGPGPNPSITGVIADGSSTIYWNGVFRSAQGQLPVSGENSFLRFYDPNVYNRETVLEVTQTGPDTFNLTDVYGNYPGQHPCKLVQAW